MLTVPEQPALGTVKHFNKELRSNYWLNRCCILISGHGCHVNQQKSKELIHFIFSDQHLLRDKLISFGDVLHYSTPGEAHFKVFSPGEKKERKKKKSSGQRVSGNKRIQYQHRGTYLFDHTERQRWAAGRSYCRSIKQCFFFFCSHEQWAQYAVSYDVQWRLPVQLSHWAPVQFRWPLAGYGWLLQNITLCENTADPH